MGLRLKNAITVTCIFLAVISATYLLFTHVLLTEFDSIEREKTNLNMQRAFQNFDAVAEDLSSRTVDWAHWDETYNFIQGKNKSYISANINYAAVAPFELVHILFLNKKLALVSGEEVVPDEETLSPLSPETFKAITTNPAVVEYLTSPKDEPLSGMLVIDNEPIFISVSTITDNEGQKPYNGFLIFTRAFSPALQAQINKRTQLSLAFARWNHNTFQPSNNNTDSAYSATLSAYGDEMLAVGTVRDLNNTPIISITHRTPRTIFQQGKASRDYIVSLMAVFLVFANGILIALLNRTVIGRLERFATKIAAIASTTDFSLRVPEDGGDEIGRLTQTFNGLIRTTEDTTTQLSQARDVALNATQAKSSFVAHVSHELRTPIHSLSGLLRILFRGESSPAKRAYIQMAQDSASTLLSTINDILDLSKIESGAIDLQNIPFSLRQTIRSTIRTVTPRIDEKPLLHFLMDIDPGVPDNVQGDPLRLQQILVNLLGNAAKFTHEGIISLKIRTQSAATNQATILFEIADTGIGMSDEQISRVFSPYIQADETIQTTYEGTGLGLSIVKTLVEQLGGNIAVESKLTSGTIFRAELPFMIDPSATVKTTPQKETRCVLVDEVGPSSAWMMAGLSRYACNVELISPSDSSALFYLTRCEHQPDFVLLSTRATETPLVIERLRRLCETLRCPIIAMLRASDMTAHEQMHTFGDIRIVDAPASAEDVLRLARHAPVPQQYNGVDDVISPCHSPGTCRILVADDTPTSRLIIREMLEEAGYLVEAVENGAQLLERIKQDINTPGTTPISIILTDIEMPVMGGVEAAQEIRKLESTLPNRAPLPIIAITAHALLDEQQRFCKAGIDYVVTKPLKPSDLDETLKRIAAPQSDRPHIITSQGEPSSMCEALSSLTERLWNEVEQHDITGSSSGASEFLDMADLFERSGDSPRRTKLILNAFIGSYREQLDILRTISDPNASKRVIIAAHSLKGLLLDVGAKHTAHLAATAEQALITGDMDSASAACTVLQENTSLVATLVERVVRHFPSA